MNKPTAAERREANRQRREEYAAIRAQLAEIATAPKECEGIDSRTRVEAARLLYEIDTNGAPAVYKW